MDTGEAGHHRSGLFSGRPRFRLVSLLYLQNKKTASGLLLLLGAMVFVRYLVLNNHSYLHKFFTYRTLAAPILAELLALRLNIQLPQRKRVRKK